MTRLPPALPVLADELVEQVREVDGYLTEREVRFLALLGACPVARGDVLEIGSFKGKSTIVLARATELADEAGVVAVDPLTSPSETDPDLGGALSGLPRFRENLERAGVAGRVEFHHTTSGALARQWTRPLRLLWIDGDHTYEGCRSDLEGFRPHLSTGAVLAIHDVLQPFAGPIRVFLEEVVRSADFGAVGLCGTIGWGQYLPGEAPPPGEPSRRRLERRLRRVLPFLAGGRPPRGARKLVYKLLRSRVPHGAVDPGEWLRRVEDRRGAGGEP